MNNRERAVTAADPRLLDARARQAIRERLGDSLVVEAGAGTGKTHALVERLEALVTSGRARIDQVVAITFTRAAAAELRERVRVRFEEIIETTPAGSPAALRLEAALQGLDAAAIQTIDAFALSLLRERPLDAGLPPRLEPLDEVESQLAFADRWREWLDAALDSDLGPQLAHAIRLGFPDPFDSLQEIARAFHESYDLLRGFEFRAPPPSVRSAGHAIVDARDEVRDLLTHERPGTGGDVGPKLRLAAELAGRLHRAGAGSDAALDLMMGTPPLKPARGRQNEWGKLADGRWVITAAKDLLGDLQGQIDHDLGQARAAALAPLLRSAAEFAIRYADERRAKGTPGFHDLLVWSRDLLGGPREGAVAGFFRARYRHVLIDEFQDTDPLQTELSLALTSAGDGRVMPGALFVVGDPKQSIYRFRGADLSSLRRVRARTAAEPVQLTITRRSHQGLVRWVNSAFGDWMGREGGTRQATRQATYVDLVSEREAPEGAGTGVWFIGGERDAPNLDPVRREERSHIVEVARSVGAGDWTVTEKEGKDGDRRKPRRSKFSDLCILFPNRTSLDDLERSLEEAGVPYTVEGQMLAYNTQDVRDLVNCLAAIDDPSDEVAIVAALRSPAFGCSDVDLYDWTRAGGKFSYLAKRGPANGPVGSALAVLRRYHEDRLGHTAAHVVERFIREMRVRELALDGGRARERWRLLGVVIEQARLLAEAGRWSLRDLVRWCEERRERQERTADGGVAELDVNAVRLMTVHYAKGLEFPIVLLTGLSGRRAGDRGPVRFDRSGDLARERMLAVRTAGFGYGDYDDLAEREKAAADEESVRLVYVAATRARDHLIVSLYRRTGDKASLASQLVGHVGEDSPLWRRLELEHPAVRTDGAEATPRATEAVDTEAGREAWLAARAEVVAKASRPYSVAATALAARGAPSPTGPAVAVPGPAGIPAPTAGGPAGSPARTVAGTADGGRAGVGAAAPQEDEPWRRGRGGTLVGRAVHAALQDIDLRTGDALVEICQRHALAEGIRDPEVVADVARLVKAVVALDVVRGAAEGRHWKEVYVTVPLPTLGGGVLEGFVDLVYVEPSGELGIVDYKTDTVGERGSLERAANPYRLQLGAYAHAVEAATGRRVGAAWIVFARRAAEGKPAAYRITDLEAAKRRAAVAAFDMVSGS